ncbi:YabP/YqfC family sporulation protein [Hespellia stercorisuis]|nr:YabP/YqfC family sporulation protein [Hespellia stercorisuis]
MAFIMDLKSGFPSFPKDVCKGAPILQVIGREELSIENYRGIIEYSENLLRIQTNAGEIRVTGNNLVMEYYSCFDLKIQGELISVEYGRRQSNHSDNC